MVKAHPKGPENRQNKVKFRPPLYRPLTHSMIYDWGQKTYHKETVQTKMLPNVRESSGEISGVRFDSKPLLIILWCCSCDLVEGGGALKERRNGRAGKWSSKHLKMDNDKLSTKNPQLDSPGTGSRPPAIPDSLSLLDVSEQKRTFWSSQMDCQDTAP